jgi:hypothetical protein
MGVGVGVISVIRKYGKKYRGMFRLIFPLPLT